VSHPAVDKQHEDITNHLHLRVDPRSLPPDSKGSDEDYIALLQGDDARIELLRQCVSKLGLEVNMNQRAPPALTGLHLSSASRPLAANLRDALAGYIQKGVTTDDHDSFRFETQSDGSRIRDDDFNGGEDAEPAVNDSAAKHIIVHNDHPSVETTPLFNHDTFFSCLRQSENLGSMGDVWFGNHLLYGEVMESTNTILAK
jgi:biotin---protein ligase